MAEREGVFLWRRFFWLCLCFAIVYLVTNNSSSNITVTDIKRTEERAQDSIKSRLDSLASALKYTIASRDSIKLVEDSLRALEPHITIRYLNEYKRIDNAGLRALSVEFDSLFSANSID